MKKPALLAKLLVPAYLLGLAGVVAYYLAMDNGNRLRSGLGTACVVSAIGAAFGLYGWVFALNAADQADQWLFLGKWPFAGRRRQKEGERAALTDDNRVMGWLCALLGTAIACIALAIAMVLVSVAFISAG